MRRKAFGFPSCETLTTHGNPRRHHQGENIFLCKTYHFQPSPSCSQLRPWLPGEKEEPFPITLGFARGSILAECCAPVCFLQGAFSCYHRDYRPGSVNDGKRWFANFYVVPFCGLYSSTHTYQVSCGISALGVNSFVFGF